ncbi:hypothetical protein [Xylocopilactobacillus apicola]|uniref:Uncharacterized protein n=1 Tax=Xylocopilactobacillus apicola TaxID=2932184 RepID=A0AAU9D8S8_9LACO|nr:hypothetical protein [Xylocopilactobacillus apicola]BDR57880.1 hypothetical protein XA3_03210 [Xylocopilactobacillus apicola]
MRGEQENIIRAKHLFSIYQKLKRAIDRIKLNSPGIKLDQVMPDLLMAEQEIIKEYDEIYLLLQVRFLMNCEDFEELDLQYIDLDDLGDNK